ncbi:phosphoenolpyruvate carboxylase [Elysia marginata]|uniref:Phosphoenolpyruvate carboxylase n=1 Tax=Elysia marginata TaxID=1093978 RepID=A0AAV4F062_9GAST|nr:phosphoenolpyruvate carboxylase [Elysia marginata]
MNYRLQRFNEHVALKYNIYNSLFMTLPFEGVGKTGKLLPIFSSICQEGYDRGLNPSEIVNEFFENYLEKNTETSQIDSLFQFIRYIERQVVLFDAIEDASFSKVYNTGGVGTIHHLKDTAEERNTLPILRNVIKKFKIRIVLTAHPTQFYPGPVLGIITELGKSIERNNTLEIKKLLSQLGKTPFFNKKKPTPYDEAVNLVWYLENVFYHSISQIYDYVETHILSEDDKLDNNIVELGFWPGGDRDGNPFVTADITLKVAQRLKSTLIRNYYGDVRMIRRKLTFQDVYSIVERLDSKLYTSILNEGKNTLTLEYFQGELQKIRALLIEKHQSLYLEEIDSLINKTKLFGFYFASIDIRQDSRIHTATVEKILAYCHKKGMNTFPKRYGTLSFDEKEKLLTEICYNISPSDFDDEEVKGVLESIYAMKEIQKSNGEKGCSRYIISNNQNSVNVLEVFALLRFCDWEFPTVDIVPLFETIDDLELAYDTMHSLYGNPHYMEHLERRGNKQVIMLGFSDGTKDGGYLKANWSIYRAKEELSKTSKNYGVRVTFFDGRGGPPARGGGQTHQFYASLGSNIEKENVQLTVQGQTISSNFGTPVKGKYDLEQFLSAGIENTVFSTESNLSDTDRKTLSELAEISYQAYTKFKNHEKFVPYLETMGTVKYYGETNIGSRPSKRGNSEHLDFSALRAIPFVGSWSQLKQNVPGFFGLGTALNEFEKRGAFEKVKDLYGNSLFFKTLVENSMMSLAKSFFKLTAYMKEDPDFGEIWNIIHNEYILSKKLLLKLTGYSVLMENLPVGKASVQMREKIALPLLTIQQHALKRVKELEKLGETDEKQISIYKKIVTRSLFGNTNASRNSA